MKNIFILILILLAGILSHAQEYILQGKIGTFPIVMHISCTGNSCYGTYFYTSSLKDIIFDGGRMGPLYMLYKTETSEKSGKDDTSELFMLKQNSDNTWSGAWKSHKGRQYNVSLAEARQQKQKKDVLYSDLRQSFFTRTKDSTLKKGKYTLEYYHIDKCGIYSFRITEGLGKAIADKVNKVLEYDANEQADAYFSCTSPVSEPDYAYSINSTFFTDNVISFTTFISYYCGGPHPDDYEHSINLNAKTGEELELPDILHLTDAKKPPKESDKWLDYINDDYAPKLISLLTSLYPTKMVKDTSDEGCDYSDIDHWSFIDWYFTAQGIYIRPSFPHVASNCSDPEWSTIPYDVLRKYKDPAKNITLP